MKHRPRLKARGGREDGVGRGGGLIGGADGTAQQANELEVQRRDDQADVRLQAHAGHKAKPGANAGTFLRLAQDLPPNA